MCPSVTDSWTPEHKCVHVQMAKPSDQTEYCSSSFLNPFLTKAYLVPSSLFSRPSWASVRQTQGGGPLSTPCLEEKGLRSEVNLALLPEPAAKQGPVGVGGAWLKSEWDIHPLQTSRGSSVHPPTKLGAVGLVLRDTTSEICRWSQSDCSPVLRSSSTSSVERSRRSLTEACLGSLQTGLMVQSHPPSMTSPMWTPPQTTRCWRSLFITPTLM